MDCEKSASENLSEEFTLAGNKSDSPPYLDSENAWILECNFWFYMQNKTLKGQCDEIFDPRFFSPIDYT
jgi:hypothetical protein